MPFDAMDIVKNTVRVGLGDGKYFNCPMLPVSEINRYRAAKLLFIAGIRDNDVEKLEQSEKQLRELVLSVCPEKYHNGLARLSETRLLAFATYLMFGDADDMPVPDNEDDAKKN